MRRILLRLIVFDCVLRRRSRRMALRVMCMTARHCGMLGDGSWCGGIF